MNRNRKKPPNQSKLDAIATAKELPPTTQAAHTSEAIQETKISKEVSEASKKALADLMKRTFGTEEEALHDRFMCQAAGAVSDFTGRELESFDYVAAAVRGTGPKDALEGMLTVQMVAVHTLAMECLRRAALPNQIDLGVEAYINRATKLMRTFANQTEALARYRVKGEQKMTIEHVHVYQGGQAIVGQVTPKDTYMNSKKIGSG